jgi:hypothetical protein
MDDGKANTGSVQAKGGAVLETAATNGALGSGTGCVVTGSVSVYNTSNTGYLCQLRIRFI